MWLQRETLGELKIETKVVTFDTDYMALTYVKSNAMTWPLLLDPDQSLYAAYGMQRGSWWQVYGPGSVWKYLGLMLKGRLPGRPGRDWRQLGGDVLIDPDGVVRLHYISADPHDRPPLELLLSMVRAAP